MSSRRDYEKLAGVLAGELGIATTLAEGMVVKNIARSMADHFKQENPRFDRAKFYSAVTGSSDLTFPADTLMRWRRIGDGK